ncbi:MAG: VWA domain-containing protein [Gemmataceae bacterium]|nr:VWA domain-containing protein [Gemmataceae bacterium]
MLPFLAPLMLAGLAAAAIPPIVHLLNRRRFDVVDWGAMQFLQISETTRRRLMIEEVLLMALRMFLIIVMVLALAGPFLEGFVFSKAKANRDVVLIFDGSYSMGYTGTGPSSHEAAKEWALEFVNELSAGDTVAVLVARQQVDPILGEPTHDLERVRTAIQKLPDPAGGADWPRAIEAARDILAKKSQRPQRDIIVISDGQRYTWSDDTTMLGWHMLANQLRDQRAVQPAIWVVNIDPQRPDNPPNWSMVPVRSSRAVAGKDREITFRTALELRGQEYKPPYKLRLEVDGQKLRDLTPPSNAKLEKGQVPFSFTHKFATPGSHLVSVIVEPDPPQDQRPPGYVIKDHLPGDNRQDFAVEVVAALPVLLVDGDARPVSPSETKPRERGTDFLLKALAPSRDPSPVVLAKVVPIQDFKPDQLTHDLGKEPGTKPRVLVLSNVARLTNDQEEAVARFLNDGGGVLVTLGERVEPKYYNEQLHRSGQGWLPARLEDMTGDESEPTRAVSPLASSFFHPALDLFREETFGGLSAARFPRWWKVTTPGRGSAALPVALLTSNDPLLVERPFLNGRVLLATVPLDGSWRTNLPTLPAFPPLAHELVYYLAGARSARHNLQPGQVLRYQPTVEHAPGPLVLQPPQGEAKKLTAEQWPFDYRETRETGVYRLESDGRTSYYVVQPDARESSLVSCTQEDRDKVSKLVPMRYENERSELALALVQSTQRQELWLWFLIGVIGLLCVEVFLTRRIALNR